MEMDINHKDYQKYKVKDEDTGDFIPYVSYANDETGEYDQYVKDSEMRWKLNENGVGIEVERKKGNIKIIKVYD